ncbi:HSX11 [Candida jiufengensis]|uniref:HSX11 n=1 Tax=Candida jiufengensis TaxID=497108 RepID=UPI00222574F4|nr:HSX11 [Candida jiufengensis]KAI5949867.1 HSX11 [Candida jiufengensis]
MSEISTFRYGCAILCLILYIIILTAAYSGFFEILLKFRHRVILSDHNQSSISTNNVETNHSDNENNEINNENDELLEGVTIIRPIKGIDPEMNSCLESSFLQNYPKSKIQLLFCIDNPKDSSIPLIKKLISKYPTIESEILISENYNPKTKSSSDHFGPNPKVNNLSKGFLKAKYDILWILDSNVWTSSNILRNSVITLNSNLNNGRQVSKKRPVKLVHHVPLAICCDLNNLNSIGISNNSNNEIILNDLESNVTPIQSEDDCSDNSMNSQLTKRKFIASSSSTTNSSTNNSKPSPSSRSSLYSSNNKSLGAKLDEMFLHTSHSKFYISLNNLSIAPCVNGKSNIYRKSDLDQSVKLIPFKNSNFFKDPQVKESASIFSNLGIGNSIKFFARYIGEDNMIGIALWENCNGRTGLTRDLVIQPLNSSNNSITDYIKRRVRWLRVRKYMVLLATLIEPTTESIICGIYGNFAISTLFFNKWFSIKLFIFHMIIWCLTDLIQYKILNNHIKSHINIIYLPKWIEKFPSLNLKSMVEIFQWFKIWLLREILALPIWIIAMFGHEIDWRGKPFKIKKDLTAEEL